MNYSAPGKLVLLGDYAVTEKATAMVAAVNRRAVVKAGSPAMPSEVVEQVFRYCREDGAQVSECNIDTSDFHTEDGRKLGVGSSAAVAVLAAAWAYQSGDERAFHAALSGHRAAFSGVGSGIDVAASYHGGVIACQKQPGTIEALPSRLPGVHLSVLAMEKSASTKELVQACKVAARWPEWLRVLSQLSEEGLKAYRYQQVSRFLSEVARYGRAMQQMGEEAGVEVVTEQMSQVMDLAAAVGGAAKPSGAGGGDVMVMWAAKEGAAAEVAQKSGAQLLDLQVDLRGLSKLS